MNWYDILIDTGSRYLPSLKTLINPIGAASTYAISQLKSAAASWYKDFKTLEAIPDSQLSPELIIEKRALLANGYSIINKIKALGLGGDYLVSQMGAVPVIGAAVIATAAGLMYYWTLEYQKFKTRISEYKSLRAQGYTDEQAKNTIRVIDSQYSMFGDVANVAKFGAIGIGAFMLFNIMKKKGFKI